jgi:uncharacterized protein YfaS (alpha-2-macroglobulin family)
MKPHLFLALVLGWLVGSALAFGQSVPAQTGALYREQLDAAQVLAAEGSHALAAAKFADAEKLAPDETQRQWCQLWRIEQEVAGGPPSTVWTRLDAELRALLAPYDKAGRARDEIWARATSLLGTFPTDLSALVEVARFWSTRPPTPENAREFARTLTALGQRLVGITYWRSPAADDALEFLRQSLASPAFAATEKAPLALLYARTLRARQRFLNLPVDSVTAAFETALEAARGTNVEPATRIYHADWALYSGAFSAGAGAGSGLRVAGRGPASSDDFERAFALLDTALASAPAQPADRFLAEAITRLRNRRNDLATPAFSLEVTEACLPGTRFSFGLTARHVAALELKLFRIDLDVLNDVAFATRSPATLPAGIEHASPIQVWTVQTGIGSLGRASSTHAWREPLDPGAYALVARDAAGRAAPAFHWFLVTRVQAFAQRIGDGDLDICVFEPDTGRLPGVVRGKAWVKAQSYSLDSVEAGRARVTSRVLHGIADRWSSLRIVGEADGQPFALRGITVRTDEPTPDWHLHLFTDRPLYLPGETALWKLTARQTVKGELQVPAGQRLNIAAAVNGDGILGTWEVTLDALGSATGKLALPPGMSPAQVRFGVAASGDDDAIAEIAAFRVEHFRAPEVTLKLDATDAAQLRRARAGGFVDLEVTAHYFSGEPLADANVTVATNFSSRTHFYDSQLQHDATASFPENALQQVTTDAQGHGRVRVFLPANLPRYAWIGARAYLAGTGVTANATFGFDLLPRGYVAEFAAAGAAEPKIRPGYPFSINSPAQPRLLAAPGQETRAVLFARDGRDIPATVTGDVSVVRQTWEEIWRTPDGALLTGNALREHKRTHADWPPREFGWERLHAGYHRETVTGFPVTTDAGGRADIAIPALPPGYYRIAYQPDDDAAENSPPLAQLELFVADATTTSLPWSAPDPLIVVAAPMPSAPIRALALVPDEARGALVTIGGLAGGESRVGVFEGNARVVEFPWRPDYWAGLKLAVVALSPNRGWAFTDSLTPARTAHEAHVIVTPLAAQSEPGSRAKFRLQSRDAAGRPVASEIALTIADAAVTSLVARERPSIGEAFLHASAIEVTYPAFSARPANAGPSRAADAPRVDTLDSEEVVLSPFEVSSYSDVSVTTMQSLAGTRLANPLAIPSGQPVRTRGTFVYTAFWAPDVKTDRNGEATVELSYPDNLTQWRITAEAIAAGNRFGQGECTTETTLPFQARLRLPRAVVAGDSIGVIGALLNTSAEGKAVQVEFGSSNPAVLALSDAPRDPIAVPASGEKVVGCSAQALIAGEATVRLGGIGADAGDAMELKLPVQEDGFFQRTGAAVRATEHPAKVSLVLPAPLDPARTRVEIQVSPGIVPALVEPLPYLIDYPYGCVEQTMSRFLPAAVVAKLLHDLKLDPAAIERRIKPSRPTAGLSQLDDVIAQSLSRLADAQNYDGSYGWFGDGAADPYMTAYVLRGLNIAAAAKVDAAGEMREHVAGAVLGFLDAKSDIALAPVQTAWVLSALTSGPNAPGGETMDTLRRTFDALYAVRDRLTPASLALLASSAVALDRHDAARVLRRNLENGVLRANTAEFGETAQWGQTSGYFDGLDGATETTALCLQALLAIDPGDPLADAAANWLLVNRQSGRWSNTRDTALALLALHDYARARGAVVASGRYRVTINGELAAERSFDRDSLLVPATVAVDASLLRPGKNDIVLTRVAGTTPCYLVATAQSWAQSTSTRPAGSFLTVARDYVRIARQPTLIGTTVPQAIALPSEAASMNRNEQVECVLVLEAKHDLDYVAITAPKPGGCEPVNPLSGWDATLRRMDDRPSAPESGTPTFGRRIYREEHPDRSVFFLPHLTAGRWEIRYRLHAAFSGDYRALPATIEAMYVPAIAGNTTAARLKILPAGPR